MSKATTIPSSGTTNQLTQDELDKWRDSLMWSLRTLAAVSEMASFSSRELAREFETDLRYRNTAVELLKALQLDAVGEQLLGGLAQRVRQQLTCALADAGLKVTRQHLKGKVSVACLHRAGAVSAAEINEICPVILLPV